MSHLPQSSHSSQHGLHHYWDTESLVVVGLFTALSKVVSLMIALLGGGMNPLTLFLKNGVATALLVVLVARVGKFGVLALYVLVGQVVSFLIAGGGMSMLLPGFLIAALLSDGLVSLCGGYRRIGAVLAGVALYDLLGRAISMGYSLLHARENMAMVAVAGVFIAIGYLGCVFIGLPCGAKFVKELRHAGIIREV